MPTVRVRLPDGRVVRVNIPEGEAPAAPTDEGISPGAAIAGGAALAGLGLAARKPGLIGKGLSGLNALRQQLMLSGFAVPKSIAGNIGAAVEAGIERKSLDPLKQLFSRQTLREAGQAYRQHGSAGPTPGVNLPGPVPGRIMGSMDVATRNALQRARITPEEAESLVLQKPLRGGFEAMESPVARFVFPFRRTPFNQFLEGLGKYKKAYEGDTAARRGLAAYSTAGAAHGAATAGEDYPVSVPFAIAGSARYGLPYGFAALAARSLAGGRGGGGIPGGVLPVSEYGVEQSLTDPLAAFEEPAAIRALERLTGAR